MPSDLQLLQAGVPYNDENGSYAIEARDADGYIQRTIADVLFRSGISIAEFDKIMGAFSTQAAAQETKDINRLFGYILNPDAANDYDPIDQGKLGRQVNRKLTRAPLGRASIDRIATEAAERSARGQVEDIAAKANENGLKVQYSPTTQDYLQGDDGSWNITNNYSPQGTQAAKGSAINAVEQYIHGRLPSGQVITPEMKADYKDETGEDLPEFSNSLGEAKDSAYDVHRAWVKANSARFLGLMGDSGKSKGNTDFFEDELSQNPQDINLTF